MLVTGDYAVTVMDGDAAAGDKLNLIPLTSLDYIWGGNNNEGKTPSLIIRWLRNI